MKTRINLLCAALSLSAVSTLAAAPFTFGVIGDTQWSGADPTGNNINTVAVNQINAVNTQFVKAGVDFVIQVGDLTNTGSDASLKTRLDVNSALNSAGIAFYGLRGNHEATDANQAYFQNNYIPASSADVTVVKGPDNTSYSVTYKDTKLVLLDINTSTNTTTQAAQTTWMSNQLATTDHTQSFVFSHKNLLGQNHKDNQFGSSNDANPADQNTFFKALADNNVKYAISGHDHMHHRSVVTSPDGTAKVQEIITASDSYKYYTPSTPYSSRETPVAQELNKTGYYLYTVDGPHVTGKYYATTPLANGDIAANPTWSLQEKFGYSLNGTNTLVAQGGSFALTHSIASGTSFGENGYRGTTMAILSGTNGDTDKTYDGRALTKDLEIGWAPASHGPANSLSDVLRIWGMSDLGQGDQTDTFALSLTFDTSGLSLDTLSNYSIASLDAAGNWLNAVDLNFGGMKTFVAGAYDTRYTLGTYGVDLEKHTAWAVLNHNSDFVVSSAIPEPSTYALLGAATLGLIVFFRRRMR